MADELENIGALADLFGLSAEGELFVQAITHPSFAHETPSAAHNQRLEFMGDAILDFVVSERLYRLFPDADEGQLTRTRAQVVSTGALARYARHQSVGQALRFGKGAMQGNLRDSDNVLADAVEALIAASFLEGGISLAETVCAKILEFGLSKTEEAGARDAKSELQEKVQALGLKAPAYRVVGMTGPAHEVEFQVEVSVRGVILASGKGRSKRTAEREAAACALEGARYMDLVPTAEPDGVGEDECRAEV